MNTPSTSPTSWLEVINEQPMNGQFTAHDTKGNSLAVNWKRSDILSRELTKFKREISPIACDVISQSELQFLRMYPEAVFEEVFLMSSAELLSNHHAQVNWEMVNEKIQASIKQFYEMDLSSFEPEVIKPLLNDAYFFVTLKKIKSDDVYGFLLFSITPALLPGEIKIINLIVSSKSKGRGLENILVNCIFRILREAKTLHLYARPTDKSNIALYESLGFSINANPLHDPNHKINSKFHVQLDYIRK